ncbi:MAG: tetratricopeptide repeat protein, partial [Planctomycetota bacterium]
MSRPKQITSVTTILFLSLSLAGTSTLLALALFTSVAEAKPASVLLQEGLYAEQIEGNLDSAIKIYEQVIAEAKAAEQTAAQAMYRIGMCYLKKGEKDKAAERFAQVSSRFPEQQDLTAKAQEQLEKIAPPTHQAELPPEVMMYIVGLHMESYAKARSLNIPANTRVYGVDDSFNLYNGGILTIKNETGQTWTGEAPVGGFSYSNLDVYNEQGEKQKTRMVRRRAGRGGRYQLLWTLDRPIEPGEMRTLGWRVKGAAKLPQEGPPGSSYHSLNMNNHYGPEVLENFFLVIPFNVAIKEQSKEYISHKRIGIFDIYQWQSRVPADTVNTVDVVLTPGPIAPAQQFSPVIERVVHSLDENPEDSFIDFDTGQLFTPPKHLQGSQADKELKRWIAAKGIDAGSEVITAEGQVADSYLRGRDMAVLSLPQEQWDTMSPVSLQEHVAGVEAKFGRGLRGGQLGGDAWNSKTTFGFKTSEGGVGLLQIMGVTDSKDSLKIRYKMLQKAVEPAVAVKRRIRGVFLPECDRTTFDLLDLASGDLVNSEPCGQMLDLSDPAGRGNIYYDKSDGQHWLVGIRGTRLRQRIDDRLSSPEPDRLSRGVAAYYAIRSLPCQYEVTTGTGDKYELKVLSTDAGADGGARIHFEYWKTAEAPAAVAGFGPVIERVIYQGGSPHDCLIDFETGKLFKVPEP